LAGDWRKLNNGLYTISRAAFSSYLLARVFTVYNSFNSQRIRWRSESPSREEKKGDSWIITGVVTINKVRVLFRHIVKATRSHHHEIYFHIIIIIISLFPSFSKGKFFVRRRDNEKSPGGLHVHMYRKIKGSLNHYNPSIQYLILYLSLYVFKIKF